MKIKTLDLLMLKPATGDARPTAYIQVLMRTGIVNYPDAISIIPDCVTYRELEAHVIKLKKELDDILRRGRKEME